MTTTTASERLAEALDATLSRGEHWPCRGDDAWVSEDREEREEAARRCAGCPVLALCAEAAEEAVWGVWAGTDRGPVRAAAREGAA